MPDPSLRPQGLKPQTPGLRPQTAENTAFGENIDDLRLQTCENAAPGNTFRRCQATDLRKCYAGRHISTTSSLRSAKTPRLATNIDDLRPQTCENAAPGDN